MKLRKLKKTLTSFFSKPYSWIKHPGSGEAGRKPAGIDVPEPKKGKRTIVVFELTNTNAISKFTF